MPIGTQRGGSAFQYALCERPLNINPIGVVCAGDKPILEWMDLLKRFQAAGKSIYVGCSAEEVKIFHRELKPNLVFYNTWVKTQREADELLQWLEANT